jgi:hypothetical protein
MTKPKILIGAFACQTVFQTLGKPGGFATLDDYFRFAADDCGIEVLSLPTANPIFDLNQAASSASYIDDLQARIRGAGISHGFRRLEFHTDGQNVCLSPTRPTRFGHFISPEYRTLTAGQIEDLAAERIRMTIDVCAKAGIKSAVGFFGGKGWPVAQAKWPAWPKHLPIWVIAALAIKWNPLLEYAADRGVVLGHELGHPENDLLTGDNFVLFWTMLTAKAKNGLCLQADASHFENVRVDAIPHFLRAVAGTGCHVEAHFKQGGVIDRGDGTCSPYGGWQNWSDASSTFFTYGTVGGEHDPRRFYVFVTGNHRLPNQSAGPGNEAVPLYLEGECVGIRDPMLAMRVGAENLRAARDGNPFIELEGLGEFPGVRNLAPGVGERVRLVREGTEWNLLAESTWGPFDEFADSPQKPHELLQLTAHETAEVRRLLYGLGFDEAGDAV